MTPIELPLPPAALQPNNKAHLMKKARATKQYRADCNLLTKVHEWTHGKTAIPGGRIPLAIQWFPKTAHEYDETNAQAALKAAFDGIADAWGVNDSRFTIARFDKMPKVKGGKVLVGVVDQSDEAAGDA